MYGKEKRCKDGTINSKEKNTKVRVSIKFGTKAKHQLPNA